MIQKTVLIFVCLLLFACSNEKKVDIPSNVLSKQKMAEVMLDVHLLEAAMSLNTYNTDMATSKNPAPPFDVFAKYKITKKQYNESFDFYTRHPDLLKDVYQLVLENLSKMQAEVMNKKEEKKVMIDTVKIVPLKKEKKINHPKRKKK